MSGLVALLEHYERLKDISSVMMAMKSLALVETKKLSRVIKHQRSMLCNIKKAAADFQTFHPMRHDDEKQSAIVVLIGSEHGFCGDFNERIVEVLESLPMIDTRPVSLVVVGSRLSAKLAERSDVLADVKGAIVTEEVSNVLNHILDSLAEASAPGLFVLAHEAQGGPILKQIIPFESLKSQEFTNPPCLQLHHEEFFIEMLDQYLLAVLYGALYESLLAQSHQRLAHMEQALNRLGETMAKLTLKRNTMRQEKIIEEIEVILSSRESSDRLE